ncbi:hypothetical protein [Curtobacterium sp. MCBA15_001]|uniref:hypothetical protein n=1 Tax=Curtobacterium sp. MCBA15_001 TaxID=1898731 RepID=UPI000910EA2E|nr:hypothetical protein [Curtobacterium sp. MCBA15_001]OIH95100.1 hypothetical protein BIU90_02885 [Curtobacterium sp. MCBA15_001]
MTTGGMFNPDPNPVKREAEARRIVAQQHAEREAAETAERVKLDQQLDKVRAKLAELKRRTEGKP